MAAAGVTKKRAGTDRGVVAAANIQPECVIAVGRIVTAVFIGNKRAIAGSRVEAACCVIEKVLAPKAVFTWPVVLAESALAPMAVFSLPTQSRSAEAPTAVLSLPDEIVQERRIADSSVPVAFGVKIQRAIADRGVTLSGGVEIKRKLAIGRVELAFSIAIKGKSASGSISLAAIVGNEGGHAVGRIVGSGRVEQKRRYTNSRIVVCVVEVKRSSANSRIVATQSVVVKSEYQPIPVFARQW